MKKLDIWTTPDILIIQLKRPHLYRTGQGSMPIDYPVEGLDLMGKVGLSEDKELVYDLFATINYTYDNPRKGIYTAFAKNFIDKQWYRYDGMCYHLSYAICADDS